jgi:hypothetical protein
VGAVGVFRGLLVRVVWLVIAMLIALGGAGIVTTMSRVPGTDAREELTWAGDQRVEPALDAATTELEALSADVDLMARTAQRALTQMVAGDTAGLGDTITEGSTRLVNVTADASRLEGSLAGIPYMGSDWALSISNGLHERYGSLAATKGLTDGLAAQWAQFTGRTLDAAQLSRLLAGHDEQTAAAARLGTAGKFQQALDALDASSSSIVDARAIRDRLQTSTDVTTLTQWLDRNAAYDAALRKLYAALIKSGARSTPEVRKALDEEQKARANLPGDTRGLVVIMSDIAQGGLNQAVIAIEEARGSLSAAIEDQQRLKNPGSLLPPE